MSKSFIKASNTISSSLNNTGTDIILSSINSNNLVLSEIDLYAKNSGTAIAAAAKIILNNNKISAQRSLINSKFIIF